MLGVFSVRRYDPETRQPFAQVWKAVCTKCGQSFRGQCQSGAVKAHVARFGGVHSSCAGDVLRPR